MTGGPEPMKDGSLFQYVIGIILFFIVSYYMFGGG